MVTLSTYERDTESEISAMVAMAKLEPFESIIKWRRGEITVPISCKDIVCGKGGIPLEGVSSWICIAFPGNWRSGTNLWCPVLEDAELEMLGDDPINDRLVEAYKAHLERCTAWMCGPDHNRRRITRVIKSLMLQRRWKLAKDFLVYCVDKSIQHTPWPVVHRTYGYWFEAAGLPAPSSPSEAMESLATLRV